jgi:peptide/nickel transport system permease protein
MIKLTPVDPVIMWGGEKASPELIQRVRAEFGLDKPFVIQYINYIKNIFKGNFGVSLITKHPVAQDIGTFFPATIELVLVAWLITLLIGIPLGILSAVKAGGLLDNIGRTIALGGISIPLFWFGMLLQILLFKQLNLLPLQGRIDDIVALLNPIKHITGLNLLDCIISGNWIAFRSAFMHIIMPAITLSVTGMAMVVRMTRSCMLEILNKDYMVMAKTYGLPKGKIYFIYGLKNALVPIVTIASMAICGNLMGSVLVESVFDWPGIGRYATRTILEADFAPIMAVVLIMGVIYVSINLLVDILYSVIDKRIVYGEEQR